MKVTTLKKLGCVLLCAAILLPAGCASGTQPAEQDSRFTELLKDDAFSASLKAKENYTEVASTERLALSVNGKTADICVQDKTSGKRWYAGAGGEGLSDAFLSQILISFANSASQISTMNSYTDGVQLGQFCWQKCENGVRVTYDIGKRNRQYCIPSVITKTRMQQKILDRVDDVTAASITGMYTLYSLSTTSSSVLREELVKKYPRLEKDDVYVLTEGLAEFASLRLETNILKSGYSTEDLAQDKEENGVVDTDNSVSFRIPVEYTLSEDSLTARVITGEILSPADVKLLTVSVLPYFGAADRRDTGYMLIPDGSGALIRLNNGRESQGAYQMPLYGDDTVMPTADIYTNYQTCHLPVYGMSRQDGGFLAIIENGAALATLQAAVSGVAAELNYVYPRFTVNQSQKTEVPYSQAGSMYFYPSQMPACDLTVRFCFLTQENADYSGMAARYRQYLIGNGTLKKGTLEEPALYLSLIGAVSKKTQVLGVSVNRTLPLTTFNQAGDILKELKKRGVETVSARYLGWCNGGLSHTAMTGARTVNCLGSTADQAALQALAEKLGDRLYWDVDLQYVPKMSLGDGYSATADSPKNVMGEVATAKTYHRVSGRLLNACNLVAPLRYRTVLESLLASFPKGITPRLSLHQMGDTLYADYDEKKFTDRSAAADCVRDTFAAAAKADSVLGVSPSDYVLGSVSEAVGVPMTSNGHYLFDEEVPFYQMVVHGYIRYAGDPLNRANSTEEETLRMIETGTMPYIEWMYAENDTLHGVETAYYAISYREWLDEAVACYREVATALGTVGGQTMTRHTRLDSGLVRTEYADGTAVYVNYHDRAITVDGHTVNARGYLVLKGGESR